MQIADVKNRLAEYLVCRIQERQAIQRRDVDAAAQCRAKLQALRQAVEALPPLERDVIKSRYFVEYLPLRHWKEVSIAVYGSASDAHLQAAYRTHRKALEMLSEQLQNV